MCSISIYSSRFGFGLRHCEFGCRVAVVLCCALCVVYAHRISPKFIDLFAQSIAFIPPSIRVFFLLLSPTLSLFSSLAID